MTTLILAFVGCKGEGPKEARKKETVAPPPAEAKKEEGHGKIAGTVSFDGAAPAPAKIDMAKDPKCMQENKGRTLNEVSVAGGKLAEVFVHVKEVPKAEYALRAEEVVLDQKGCMYSPRVLGIQTGQKLTIVNSDPLLHNVHGLAKRDEFNLAMPTQGMKLERTFKKPEVLVPVQCEVHAWMHAWIGVVDHPFYAVTGADGAFEIANVPVGKHTIELVHPKLGSRTAEIEVKKDETARVEVTFGSTS